MKFRVHVFREFREAYEVEAEDAEAAQNLIDMKGRHNTEVAYKRLEDAVKELK